MQLSKRLEAVAGMVTPGNRVADIGCDHAYVSIYLLNKGIAPSVVAMDVNEGPLVRARENIKKYGFGDRIDTRKSNGLEKLNAGEADTVLIAGMGGALMVDIILEHKEVVSSLKELILQPQSEIFKVRQMLCDIGFFITHENMVKEDGKYYVMMKAEESVLFEDKYKLAGEEHFHFGRLLLEQRHPILLEFFNKERLMNQNIYQSLLAEPTENSILRQAEIKDKLELIDKGLSYFQKKGDVEYENEY